MGSGKKIGHFFKKLLGNKARCYTVAEHQIDYAEVSPHAIEVCKVLQKNGYQAYIVGGAVRDLILGKRPKDFDVATNATPAQIRRCFRRVLIIGKRFQIAHVVFGREVIETSTFRSKSANTVVDHSGRIIRDNEFGGTIADDAKRRDLTINALYYDPVKKVVIDYHEGLEDVRKRIIRMIGNVPERYKEDPVRILRIIRFAAKLDARIVGKTLSLIPSHVHLLAAIPKSRLFDETVKLLTCGHAVDALKYLRQYRLQPYTIPFLDEVLQLDKAEQLIHLLLQRTDERLRTGKTVSPSFLFASLMWPLIAKSYQSYKQSFASIPAMEQAIQEVLAQHTYRDVHAQRRLISDMRDMWMLQARLAVMTKKQIYYCATNPRFRAGVDFFEIRALNGEVDLELANWWVSFANAGDAERAHMVAHYFEKNTEQKSSKRPRKRRRRSEKVSAS